jgi:hypothetical protein
MQGHDGRITTKGAVMGYICPDCGEGLPEDTLCPCTMAGGDFIDEDDLTVIRGPLTAEIASIRSPVRQFLGERFTSGLRDLQRRYREAAPPLVVSGVDRADADPGTVGTAADWLLRFLVHPQPDLHLAMLGTMRCARAKMNLLTAFAEITESLGCSRSSIAADFRAPAGAAPEQRDLIFTGPLPGNAATPEHLARCCWALALLTEGWRGGPMVAARGPLGQFRGQSRVCGDDLLGLAPPAGVDQLARFRRVFETTLIPQLAARPGEWALGPTFAGSELIKADADLIAAGLLLDLKTSTKKLSLPVTDILEVIGYALLDFDDEYGLNTVGIFSARYAYLATWGLGALLDELAGHEVSVAAIRGEFQRLLLASQGPGR